MGTSFRERLAGTVLLADGAWGTLLQDRGLQAGFAPDEWNLSHPEDVESVARSYVDAGSDLILTNTFGGNPFILGRSGLADKVRQINREGVLISRRAASQRAFVIASIGPSGEFLEPLGTISPAEMQDAFRRQVEGLLEGDPDGFVVETMSDPAEAICAVQAIRDVSNLAVIVSMTFDSGADGLRTMMGAGPEQIVQALGTMPIDALGANCGRGPESYVRLTARLRDLTPLPLWIKANAGMPQPAADGRQRFPLDPRAYAAFLPDIVCAGGRVIGGCCGTTPEHIRAMRAVLQAMPPRM